MLLVTMAMESVPRYSSMHLVLQVTSGLGLVGLVVVWVVVMVMVMVEQRWEVYLGHWLVETVGVRRD